MGQASSPLGALEGLRHLFYDVLPVATEARLQTLATQFTIGLFLPSTTFRWFDHARWGLEGTLRA